MKRKKQVLSSAYDVLAQKKSCGQVDSTLKCGSQNLYQHLALFQRNTVLLAISLTSSVCPIKITAEHAVEETESVQHILCVCPAFQHVVIGCWATKLLKIGVVHPFVFNTMNHMDHHMPVNDKLPANLTQTFLASECVIRKALRQFQENFII